MQTKTSSHREGRRGGSIGAGFVQLYQIKIEGLFNFQGLKITEVGSDIFVLFFTRRTTCIISRFEDEAANVHKGGDLR